VDEGTGERARKNNHFVIPFSYLKAVAVGYLAVPTKRLSYSFFFSRDARSYVRWLRVKNKELQAATKWVVFDNRSHSVDWRQALRWRNGFACLHCICIWGLGENLGSSFSFFLFFSNTFAMCAHASLARPDSCLVREPARVGWVAGGNSFCSNACLIFLSFLLFFLVPVNSSVYLSS